MEVYKLRNKTSTQEPLNGAGGESILVQPFATVSVDSTFFSQVPDTSKFEFISPTLGELAEQGVFDIGLKTKPKPSTSNSKPKTTKVDEPIKSSPKLEEPSRSNSNGNK